MDVRNLQFKDGYFDVVIDKALLDAIVCGGGAVENSHMMLSEIHRVLSPTGTYICITHGKEKQRKKYLKNVKRFNWMRMKFPLQKPQVGQTQKEHKIPKEDDKKNFHFLYVCKKQVQPVIDSSDEEAVAHEQARIEMERKKAEDQTKISDSDTDAGNK
uniref:Methyltransferase type 11 domain-containing protein n=1 Tax=Strombidium inclinatum TaxID=197538 RepID=A0A7S3IFR0_9SPIT|mmetsp:Transcript_16348/g.25277  ORF Transcript_16348/g.25277 Transcript_16348/m.25277 type:complete len:158 (+) Transcript_16348:319-792(+)|eukprot:CAMPEP_0170494898 /NCGR_PEP_ID=MMETSP0208-20121228/14904_1 /TAXON_ID=197538 /ORGANISM="Strombidium inclinatum, Strain S3" /LENGTH=157 /DNA_ID=CAMNT_0010771015 /DNA_START=319 /DNA_END=792 /DNA_ORIENTATION=-